MDKTRRLPPEAVELARAFADGERAPVEPRPAATVVLLRGSAAGVQAYLIRRHVGMAFAGGMYAFPGGGVDALERYDGSTSGPVILANSTDLQAVRHPQLDLVAANSYSNGTHQIGKFSIDGAASVIVQDADGGRTRIAVSDPTFGRDEIAVTVPGRRPVVAPHDGVIVQPVTGGTRVEVTW